MLWVRVATSATTALPSHNGALPMTQSLELLTTKQRALYLNKPVNTIRGWRHRKVGPTGFRLGRDIVYRRETVEAWLAEREKAA